MKVYKYDNICMIAIKKDTKNKLLEIKKKYHAKNIDVIVKKLIDDSEELSYYDMDTYDKCNS